MMYLIEAVKTEVFFHYQTSDHHREALLKMLESSLLKIFGSVL